MKRLMFACAAILPLIGTGCHHCNNWLDATFCQPCNKGQILGGCWGGQCGYGQKGCNGCVRGQGEEIAEGEITHDGGTVYEGEGIVYGDGMASSGCDCESCRGRRHGRGLFGDGGMRGRGGPPMGGPQVAGGPPTAQVAYPYYTTRAPRDFLNPNPRSIGR